MWFHVANHTAAFATLFLLLIVRYLQNCEFLLFKLGKIHKNAIAVSLCLRCAL